MIVRVRAKPASKSKARVEVVEKNSEVGDLYDVFTDQPPERGRANAAIAKLLAEFFGVRNERVRIVSGDKAKFKRFEVDLTEL